MTFGDPDFLNGPGHALKLVRALHAEFPVKRVRVSVRKPGIAWAEWAGVTCERP